MHGSIIFEKSQKMMERVVRNNTRKSSLFKIQAEKNKFEEHLADFGLCKLFQVFPECQGHKDFLLELTETFIAHSFEVARKSPFFKGMNYNGREMGFSQSSNSIHYKQWLPGVKEAFLIGSFAETKYPLDAKQDGHFQLVIQEEGQIKIMEGARVQLQVIDMNDKTYKIAPPSSKIVQYDPVTQEHYGICMLDQTYKNESVELNILLAYQIDTHQMSLEEIRKTLLPQIVESKFNAVVLKNLFSYKDQTLKASSLNSFGLKLSYKEVEELKDLIQKLKQEQILVLFQLDFDFGVFQALNPLEQGYQSETNGAPFNFEHDSVAAFLLSFVSHYLKHFNIDGYKVANIDKLMLQADRMANYACKQAPLGNFIPDCTEGSILFIKMMNMVLRRTNSQSISYCTSSCKIPGMTLALDQGGLGFTFSSQIEAGTSVKNLLERTQSPYFNVQTLSSVGLEAANLTATSFISKKGVVHTGQILFQDNSNRFKLMQSLQQTQWFRAQADYFNEEATECKYVDGILSFERQRFSFLCNLSDSLVQLSVAASSANIIYGCNAQNVIFDRTGGGLMVQVPKQSVLVIETSKGE